MNIGIVCYPTYGGSGVVATELGKGLAEKGHKVHFITYTQPVRLNIFNENICYHEVYVPNYPLFLYPPYELALASEIVNVVKHEKLDILHVHYAIPHASSAFMAKQILKTEGIKIPVVTTLHGTDITLVGKDASFAPVVTFSINQSDKVTAVSNSLKEDTYKIFPIQKSIEVIPNFINLERFKRQSKEHFRRAICPKGEKLLVHTSNFRKVKRIQDILFIFQQLQKHIPVKLLIIGDGPERVNLEELCRELGCQEDVRFLGKLDAIEEVLSIADAFMMPSEKESFGLAALEAMACEVPVISSNAGGLPELNIHGVTGFVSEIGDIEDMVKNTLTLLKDENLPTFKKNALARAKDFEISKILPMYERVYQECLEQIQLKPETEKIDILTI
ncbi:MAG: N-acetyl-alpha-D-glucosaminyl L-malate synthase BshA [Microscillaceae bacterium]|nr:N-acetyl-alpha-D-glucosaminyl L-malate synthase BshA [Microscillaceae bacterium]MDW8459918.1 N-acetyl-alpha-D-glucosaminyl L-malate synthase BshA [Cytophagales bacterium]